MLKDSSVLALAVLAILGNAQTQTSQQTVDLTPEFPSVEETGEITLTCRFTYNGYNILTWRSDKLSNIRHYIFLNNCTTDSNDFVDRNQYEYNCSKETVNLTVKGITKEDHNSQWTCFYGFFYSNTVKLYVVVPINNIVIINSSDGQVEFPENTAININCKSSPSRPNATIEWRIDHDNTSTPLISTAIYWRDQMNMQDGLFPSESFVSLNLNRTFNGHVLFCTGNNTLKNHISNSTRLNVTYPPSSNKLKIEGLENGTNYLIEEYTVKTLVCSIDESNPKTELSWSCTNALFERNTTDSISWTALRGKNTQCICQSFYMLLRYAFVFVNVDVLYKPEHIVAHLYMDSVNVKNVSLTFNVTENNSSTLVLTCFATANPPPTIYWEGQQTNWSNIFRLNVTRGLSGQYKCQAINSMNFTDQNPKTGKSEQSYNIDILYPPDVQELKNQVVVEKDSVNIRCSLYEGKTTFQNVTWWKSMTMISNNSVLEIRNLNRTHLGSYACFLNFTMVPTYGVPQTDFRNKSFMLDVLFSDQQYQQLTIFTHRDEGPNMKVYENLRISFPNKDHGDCKTAGQFQRAPKQTHV